ncbi:helix-turn-helix domain-containing protein [Fructilactobacillus sp. Tb1]|uniref:helix-turn-helix domain-containing protein n=1 Tax=Fructilactobacillus sp. Tb1 TaxID=3422304 RepID=UPI003D287DF9
MDNGQLIKKLRKERGISQAQLSNGISTRTTLSSFENKKSKIPSDILFEYLKRMNISPEEYSFYLNNDSKSEKEYALQYFNENIYKAKEYEIRQRIHNYQKKYKDYNDFFFCCLSIELKLFLNKSQEDNVFDVKEDTEIIKNYLNSIQQWGHFEISLFSNCLYIFNSDYIRATFKILFKKTKNLSQIDSYKNDVSIFINNCIILSFERNELNDANTYINSLSDISNGSPRKTYDKLMCNYYKELLHQITIQENKLMKSIATFRELGFSDHANRLDKFKIKILSNYIK